jgi:hypothetical protein
MTRSMWFVAAAMFLQLGWGAIPNAGIAPPYPGWAGHYGSVLNHYYGYTGVPLRSAYETTPFTYAGQTVCSPGTVDERPEPERIFWHPGERYGPKYVGMRCIKLP